jgi:hypothetical protein
MSTRALGPGDQVRKVPISEVGPRVIRALLAGGRYTKYTHSIDHRGGPVSVDENSAALSQLKVTDRSENKPARKQSEQKRHNLATATGKDDALVGH